MEDVNKKNENYSLNKESLNKDNKNTYVVLFQPPDKKKTNTCSLATLQIELTMIRIASLFDSQIHILIIVGNISLGKVRLCTIITPTSSPYVWYHRQVA
jgi:hypothetical protein